MSIKLVAIGLAILAVLGLFGKYVSGLKEQGRQEIRDEWRLANDKAAEDSRKAVSDAVAKAKEQFERDEKQRKDNEQVERDKQAKRVEDAVKEARAIDRRYKEALAHNASCAAQMEAILLCPVE